jgi:uncharacterized protein (DUF1330 family)
MPAYVIYQGEVTDPERYAQYRPLAAESIEAAGGRYLARGGEIEVLEGEPPPGRTVVVQFPDRQAALAWYHGEAYTAARAVREGACRARMYVVDGVG